MNCSRDIYIKVNEGDTILLATALNAIIKLNNKVNRDGALVTTTGLGVTIDINSS